MRPLRVVALLVLLATSLFAVNTVRVQVVLHSGAIVYVDFDSDNAHTLSNIYRQVGSTCAQHSLQNDECDSIASSLFEKQFFTVETSHDISPSPDAQQTHRDDLVVRNDMCLAQQVMDYCIDNALGLGAECDDIYTRFQDQLLSEVPEAVMGSCSQGKLSVQQSVLSLELMQQHLPHSGNTPRSVAVKGESMKQSVNIWVFWSTGADHMPWLTQYTLFHNRHMAEAYGHRFHLVTLDNLSTYMENAENMMSVLALFPPSQQSDIIRYHLLYTFGGVWLAPDFIISGDIYALFAVMIDAHASFLATEEFSGKLSNAVLACQPGSPVVAHLLRQVETQLELYAQRREAGLHYMHRDFLGPPLVQEAVKLFGVTVYPPTAALDITPAPENSARSVLLMADFTLATMYFAATWHHQPTLHYDLWLRPSAAEAEHIATMLREASLGIVGLWTLMSDGTHQEDSFFWHERVLHDSRSVFHHLICTAQASIRFAEDDQHAKADDCGGDANCTHNTSSNSSSNDGDISSSSNNNNSNVTSSNISDTVYMPFYLSREKLLAMMDVFSRGGELMRTLDIQTKSAKDHKVEALVTFKLYSGASPYSQVLTFCELHRVNAEYHEKLLNFVLTWDFSVVLGLHVDTYSPSGEGSVQFQWPTHMAFGPGNQEIVTDYKSNQFLYRNNPSDLFQKSPLLLHSPHSLLYNPADGLYYANDSGNDRIIAFTDLSSSAIKLQTKEIAGVPLQGPHDIVLDHTTGWIYTINPNSAQVFRFSAIGENESVISVPVLGYARALSFVQDTLYVIGTESGRIVEIVDWSNQEFKIYDSFDPSEVKNAGGAGSWRTTGLVFNDVDYFRGFWYASNYFTKAFAYGTNYDENKFIRFKTLDDLESGNWTDLSPLIPSGMNPYYLTVKGNQLYVAIFNHEEPGRGDAVLQFTPLDI